MPLAARVAARKWPPSRRLPERRSPCRTLRRPPPLRQLRLSGARLPGLAGRRARALAGGRARAPAGHRVPRGLRDRPSLAQLLLALARPAAARGIAGRGERRAWHQPRRCTPACCSRGAPAARSRCCPSSPPSASRRAYRRWTARPGAWSSSAGRAPAAGPTASRPAGPRSRLPAPGDRGGGGRRPARPTCPSSGRRLARRGWPSPRRRRSALLLGSLAGFCSYPPAFLPKSTVFAAYCAHGLLPVCAGRRPPGGSRRSRSASTSGARRRRARGSTPDAVAIATARALVRRPLAWQAARAGDSSRRSADRTPGAGAMRLLFYFAGLPAARRRSGDQRRHTSRQSHRPQRATRSWW